MTPLAAYLLLFVVVGIGFILAHLLLGKLIRPRKPDHAKGTIYECGEPTIGSSWIQFDVRFYVVALLFVIFDVEVAFFFPWAEVFGKACTVAAQPATADNWDTYRQEAAALVPPYPEQEHARGVFEASTPPQPIRSSPTDPGRDPNKENQRTARDLAWLSFGEIVVFFGVLLVGFAYLWRHGDLAWVRSLAAEQPTPVAPPPVPRSEAILASAGPRV